METFRYLIPYFLKISLTFFLAAIIWWLVSILFPGLNAKVLFMNAITQNGTSTLSEFLPSPRRFGEIMHRGSTTRSMPTLYVHGQAFNGYANSNKQAGYSSYNYVTYTGDGTLITDVNGNPVNKTNGNGNATGTRGNSSGFSDSRSMYVRNLSIYENGHIYTGLSFVGEARSNMFKEGKFPVAVLDQNGKLVGVAAAIATNDWTVAGWTRFESKIIYILPSNVPCKMIFEEALTESERATRRPLQIPMNIRCN